MTINICIKFDITSYIKTDRAKMKGKEMDRLFCETIRKYGWAISQNLYPSQTKKLKEALKEFEQNENVYIADSFVKLAFDMIVSDLMYYKERQIKTNE